MPVLMIHCSFTNAFVVNNTIQLFLWDRKKTRGVDCQCNLGTFFLAGANNVNAEHDVTVATETMNVVSSDIAPTLTSESKEDFTGIFL